MPYNITDKTLTLALPYGVNNLHTGNGKLVRHFTSVVGSELQVKFQLAIALGVIHTVKKVTYDGQDIPAQNYIFHKGEPDETAADAIFPQDVDHPGASFININLPAGMKVDNEPDKAVVQIEGRETADYNSSGAQTAFGYSTNPARAVADGVKIICGDVSLIAWSAWDEFKAWCAETITITKDGQTVQVPRFRFDQFFIPPFTLKQFLDRVCEMTCSDWQEGTGGKIVMIPAKANRQIAHTFDLTNLAWDFEFEALQSKNLYNGVRGLWRNLDDALLAEGEPILVDRRASEYEPENFYEINLGACYQDQGERVCHYFAKSTIDLKDYFSLRAGYASYHLLPADLATVTHPVPEWSGVRSKIIKKLEKEDRSSPAGIENTASGYKYYLRREPVEPYSDTDHTPLTTRTPVSALNPFSAPPLPTLALAQDSIAAADGSILNRITGTINFAAFAFRQLGKVYWMKPGGEYEFLRDVRPDAGNSAVFFADNPPAGTSYFKVVPVNEDYLVSNSNVSTANQKAISVVVKPYYVSGYNVANASGRALTGFDADGRYTGRDTAPVPVSVINAAVTLATVKDNNLNTDFELQGVITDRNLQTSQADSIDQSEVTVYDKFGNIAKKPDGTDAVFYAGYNGAGTLASGDFKRKYTDAREEAFYRLRVKNSKGWSGYKYLSANGSLSADAPALKVFADSPRDLSASTLSSSSIRFSATFDFSGGKTLTLQKREIGQAFADWTSHAAGITALPYDAVDLASDKELEFRFLSSSGTNNASNITRAKTFQVVQQAPPRPAPSGLTVVPDTADPDDDLNVDWVRNATDNTDVEIEINGTISALGSATQTHYDIDNIGQQTSRSVRIRNKWNSGVTYSEWTQVVTGQTEATPTQNPPQNFSATFDNDNNRLHAHWNHGDGSGQYIMEISSTGANPQAASNTDGWTNIISNITGTDNDYFHAFAQTTAQQSRYLRLKRADISGWVLSGEIIIPAEDASGNLPPDWNYINYTGFRSRFELSWTPRGGTGNYTIQYQPSTFGLDDWASANQLNILTTLTYRTIFYSQPYYDEQWHFRIKRNDVASGDAAWSYYTYVTVNGNYGGNQNL